MIDALRRDLRDIVVVQMQTEPAHDLAHLDRVWTNAARIAQSETGVDHRVLVAAAYLHDLVNLPKSAPDRKLASRMSAEAAGPILNQLGFSDREASETQHAIAAHSYSANIPPKTLEARIIRDADRLDALGAIGIARWFAVSGQADRAFYDPEDPFSQSKAPNDLAYTLDHWHLKLSKLAAQMVTPKGKEIALQRHETMQRYLNDLRAEIA